MSNVYELSESSFRKEVLESPVPTLVAFCAPWCAPCRMIGELAAESAGTARVGKVDVDNDPHIAPTYGVDNIPTLLIFRDGEVIERFVGVVSKADLERALDLVTT